MIPPSYSPLWLSGVFLLVQGGLAIPLSCAQRIAREGYQREPYWGYTENEVVYTWVHKSIHAGIQLCTHVYASPF